MKSNKFRFFFLGYKGWFHPYVPIKLFWAVPAIYLFTGGAMVAASMNLTMVTDVVKKSQR